MQSLTQSEVHLMFMWLLVMGMHVPQAKTVLSQLKEEVVALSESSDRDLHRLREIEASIPLQDWREEKQNLSKMLERNFFLLQLWTKFLNQGSHPLAIPIFHRLTQPNGILPFLVKTLDRSQSRKDWREYVLFSSFPDLEKYVLFFIVTLYKDAPPLESILHIPFCPHVRNLVSDRFLLGLIQPHGCLFLHQGFVKQKVRDSHGRGEDLWSLLGKVAHVPPASLLLDVSEALGFSWFFPFLGPDGRTHSGGRHIQGRLHFSDLKMGDLVCYHSGARRVSSLHCSVFESWTHAKGGRFKGIEPSEERDAFETGERELRRGPKEVVFLRLQL